MRANVKPLTHWIIYKKYTVHFHKRTPAQVTGILKTPDGDVPFTYEPQTMRVQLPKKTIQINEYGWETEEQSE